jgi:hypothetical protein
LLYDRWATASRLFRQRLLIPLNNELIATTNNSLATATTTVVRIESEGVHKTVITMSGSAASSELMTTNANFRFLQECLDWVLAQLVSLD